MSAKPARRIPHSPRAPAGRRSSNQGASINEALLPRAKNAMDMAPPITLPASAATISAE